MTNKEKYKKAFQTLHSSAHLSLEAEMMEKRKHAYQMKKIAAACVATAVVFGSMTVAYAADFGGIQQKITAWFHGKQTQMQVKQTEEDGIGYTYSFTDEDGNIQERSGGGVAIDDNGKETPLSAEEVLAEAGNDVETGADGRVYLYYYDKKVDVTDLFGEDGICRVALEHEGQTIYFKIESGGEGAVPGSYRYESGPTVPEDAENYTFVE